MQFKANVLKLVARDGMKVKGLVRRFQLDKEVVLAAVGQNGKALELVEDKFKADEDVVMAAVKQVRGWWCGVVCSLVWCVVVWCGVAWCSVEGYGARTDA